MYACIYIYMYVYIQNIICIYNLEVSTILAYGFLIHLPETSTRSRKQ